MATTLYPDIVGFDTLNRAQKWNHGKVFYTPLSGGGSSDTLKQSSSLSTVRGTGVQTGTISTVTGPTGGAEDQIQFVSAPLTAAVTISGTITCNVWAFESNMSANAAINVAVYRLDVSNGTRTLVAKSTRTTELGTVTAVNNFTVTPTSTAFNKGDRIIVVIFADDAGTMAATYSVTYAYAGTTGAANGDTFVTFTETFSLAESDPAGTTIYPTPSVSSVSTASDDRAPWTSRGAGVTSSVTNTAAGPTSPIQATASAGGTVVDWFTQPLTAFTLSGPILVNLRSLVSASFSNVNFGVEIARVAGDGTSPTVFGANSDTLQSTNAEVARQFFVSGQDLAISNGQRLRIRVYIDDDEVSSMVTARTATFRYGSTSGGASGDSYLIFNNTLTEFTSTQTITVPLMDASPTVYAPTVFTRQIVGALPLADGSAAVYAPTASQPAASQSIGALGLVDGGAAVYAPTVQPDQFVTLPLADASPATYAPTLLPQPVTATLPLVDGGAAVYAPTVQPDQFLTLGLVDGAAATYAPSVVRTIGALDLVRSPSLAFVCGFEAASDPSTPHWQNVSGAMAASTTHVRSGTTALKATALTLNTYVTTPNFPANTRHLAFRLSLWATGPAPTVNPGPLFEWVTTSSIYFVITPKTDGYLWLESSGGGTPVQSLLPLPTDQFVDIDVYHNATANPHTVDWQINGVPQPQFTLALAAWNLIRMDLGGDIFRRDTWFDDFALSHNPVDYPLGPASITGTAEDWSNLYPLVAAPKSTLTLGLVDSGPAVYAPTILPKSTLTVGLVDGTAAVYAPILANTPFAREALVDNPYAWYRMGEASGAVIDSMYGTSGSVIGTVTRDVAGILSTSQDDGAIDFDGSTGAVVVAGHAGLELGDGPFTIVALIDPDAMNNGQVYTFIAHTAAGSGSYQMSLQDQFGADWRHEWQAHRCVDPRWLRRRQDVHQRCRGYSRYWIEPRWPVNSHWRQSEHRLRGPRRRVLRWRR
jgi:hypothetical protein